MSGYMPRACHNCRQRKVRCDRTVPCSNCSSSGLACSGGGGTRSGSRPVQDAPRQNEGLERRLEAIEEAIQGLRRQQPAPTTSGSATSQVRSPEPEQVSNGSANLREGDSSFVKQSLQAAQVDEITTSEASRSPAVMLELANLRSVTLGSAGSSEVKGSQTPSMKCSVGDALRLPPVDFVLKILRQLRSPCGGKALLCTFHGIHDCQNIEDLAKRIYFPVDPPIKAEVTLLNGMISIILRDLLRDNREAIRSGQEEEEMTRQREECEKNFQAGAQSYEVMAIASPEHAMILGLAMAHAQDKTNIDLEWSLTTTAARHCISLGYNREDVVSQLSQPASERARRLFWRVYMFDKSLSARLGRTSAFQEYDYDLEHCPVSTTPGQAPWDLAFNGAIGLSRLLGRIYELLFSAAAKHLDTSQRQRHVTDLTAALEEWREQWVRIDPSHADEKEVFQSEFAPATVLYYSILTLCRRAEKLSNSAHDITPACYEAAQNGLRAHLAYVPRLTNAGQSYTLIYTLWIFYYTSFTPYVVVFLHCIANSSLDDLNLLKEVVDSLDQIGPMFEFPQRQMQLCKALYKVANAFVESQKTVTTRGAYSAGEFCMPLEDPFAGNWAWLDPNFELAQFTDSLASQWEDANQGLTTFSNGH